MGRKSLFALLFLFIFLTTNIYAAPQIPPMPNPPRHINDFGGMLNSETIREMEKISLALKKHSGVDLAVVTVEDLEGYPIEQYSLELFRTWGLGDKEKNNGALLLVNKKNALDHRSGRVRLEIGYGLEGAIPDGKAGRILDDYVLPSWSQEDFDSGIFQGFMATAALIAEEYGLDLDAIQDLSPLKNYESKDDDFPLWLILLIVIMVIYLNSLAYKRRGVRRSSTSGRNNHWGGPFIGGGGSSGRPFGGGGGGGFGGFGGGSSGGGGASR